MAPIMAVLADCDEVTFGCSTAARQRNDVMHVNTGLSTSDTVDSRLALPTVTLEDFTTDVPPARLRVSVGVTVPANSLGTTKKTLGTVPAKHKIVPFV